MLRKTGIWASRTIKILGIIVAAAVFFGLGLYWISVHNAHMTRINVSVDTPSAAHFTDDRPMVLLNDTPPFVENGIL